MGAYSNAQYAIDTMTLVDTKITSIALGSSSSFGARMHATTIMSKICEPLCHSFLGSLSVADRFGCLLAKSITQATGPFSVQRSEHDYRSD